MDTPNADLQVSISMYLARPVSQDSLKHFSKAPARIDVGAVADTQGAFHFQELYTYSSIIDPAHHTPM